MVMQMLLSYLLFLYNKSFMVIRIRKFKTVYVHLHHCFICRFYNKKNSFLIPAAVAATVPRLEATQLPAETRAQPAAAAIILYFYT